jgi:hypothetical protein
MSPSVLPSAVSANGDEVCIVPLVLKFKLEIPNDGVKSYAIGLISWHRWRLAEIDSQQEQHEAYWYLGQFRTWLTNDQKIADANLLSDDLLWAIWQALDQKTEDTKKKLNQQSGSTPTSRPSTEPSPPG